MNIPRWGRHLRIQILRFLQKINLPEEFYMLFLAGIIGVFAGIGAYLLNSLINIIHLLFYQKLYTSLNPNGYWFLVKALFPALGGLVVGVLVYKFAREVKGHGVPSVIEAVANNGGYIRPRVSLLTSITASTTIGSGGSAGKEGPIVQIGAAIGSTVGQVFGVSSDRLKVLVGTGAAAGLAAVFNAPVTGVLFALEVILADFSISTFSPIIFATVISTTLSHYMIGSTPVLKIPVYYLESAYEYPMYIVMGIAGGMVAVFFTQFLYATENFFNRLKNTPEYLKPAIGGLLMGALALGFPELYGFDDTAIHSALFSGYSLWILLFLMFFKIIATSFTLGSGGSGGLFTPSLFIGATFGAFFGTLVNHLFPGVTASPGAYALVGMGIMIAGTTHATISAMLLIFEITYNYQVILPLMLGTIVATITARLILKENIYTKAISVTGEYIRRGRNLSLLQSIPIRPYIRTEYLALPEHTPFKRIIEIMKTSEHTSFPVVNKKGELLGVLSMRDIRPYMFDEELYPALIAKDVVNEEFLRVSPDDSLADVLNLFDITDAEMLPVTIRRNSRRLAGVIFRDELMRLYRKAPLLKPGQATKAKAQA